LPLPVAGESRNAPPSVDDIARVAVAALLDPVRHAGKSYRPTGPKLLTVTEMATVIGRVVGHSVRHVRTPLALFYKGAKAQGREAFLLSGLRYWFQDNDRGAFAVGAPNDTVRELTGQDAEDFETIARRHAALPASRQSFAGRLAAFARFMAVPILPGFDPVAYDRAQEQPVPGTPRLALDDAGWTTTHRGEASFMFGSVPKEALA
jgi:NAD(P)H dehydrogenase (quinone)